MAARNPQYQVRALERALDILAVFSLEQPERTLSELAAAAELAPSTALRLLSILERYSYVERSDDTDRYRIGVGLFERGSIYIQTTTLEAQAREPLADLAAASNQTASLAVLDGNMIVHISVVQPERAIRYYAPVGQREMAHCTGLGKALLAGLPDDRLDDLYADEDLPRRTPNTIPTRDALRTQLEKVRSAGYAVDDEEGVEGLRCVAAPVLDDRNRVVAAVSASGAAGEFSDITIPRIADAVRATARMISRRLGYSIQEDIPV
jgi:IclR family acetate operon transcriptional repressor